MARICNCTIVNPAAFELYAAAHDLQVDQLDPDDRDAAVAKLRPILDRLTHRTASTVDEHFDTALAAVGCA